jgi:hypothetical protein
MYYTPQLFPVGKVVATSTVVGLVPQAYLIECLRRHMIGDWGCVGEEDTKTNNEAVEAGFASCPPTPLMRPSRARGMATTRSGSSRKPTAA